MRKKMTEQVIGKGVLLDHISAGATSAHVSAVIDRKGYNTAYLYGGAYSLTIGNTQEATVITVYNDTVSTGATMSAWDTANSTFTLMPTYSNAVTLDGIAVDLSGCKRYLQIYATPTGATTVTANLSVTVVLGDAVIEPAT